MTTSPVALGIVGAGVMGERMLNAALGRATDTVRIAGIWDPSSGAMARMRENFPAAPACGSAEEVIRASDCLYIASPPATHLAHARAALASGRTVFCEKPLAVDLADARAFVGEAGDKGAVNFPFASSLAVASLQQWLREGVIGRPRRIRIEMGFAAWPRHFQQDAASWLDGRREGGFTREVGSHFVFLCRRLAGALSGLEARVTYPSDGRSERRIEANFRAGDLPVTMVGAVGETDRDEHNEWLLEGEEGALRLRDWSVAERQTGEGAFEPAPDALPIDQVRMLVLRRQLEGVARMTRGGPHHLATLREALDVQEVVEAILAS